MKNISEMHAQVKFKKEWNYVEHQGALLMINKLFKDELRKRNIKETAEMYFGLPYTSSSDFAEVSNTNVHHEVFAGWNVEYFAITEAGFLVMVLGDKDENERFFMIGFDEE